MESRKRKLTSEVWNHFTPNEDRSSATCNLCDKIFTTTKGCTTSLGRHLSSKHNIYTESLSKRETVNSQLGMSAQEFIARLAAVDGLPFSTIASSSCIKLAFSLASGTSLPSSPSSVRDSVVKFADSIKTAVVREIVEAKSARTKFAVTLDEWTSCSNKRYLNANLHTHKNFWNLGLSKINGSFTSLACLELLEQKLNKYGIGMEDISTVITDGAAVMKRFGEISGKLQQLCFAHGIHLAVCDVIFAKANPEILPEIHPENIDDDNEALNSAFENVEEEEIIYVEDIQAVITKVRTVVKLFRKSPLKNEILTSHHTGDHQLILDTKTRWNSTLLMLHRFCLMKDAIRKAFIDLREDLLVTEEDFNFLEELVKILNPIKLAVEKMCKRDATLITADAAVKFMLEKLSMCDSVTGTKIFDAMKQRIQERRTYLSDVLSLLHYNEENLPGYREGYFNRIPRNSILNHVKNIFTTITEDTNDQEESMSQDVQSESLLLEVSQETELNIAIREAQNYKAARAINTNSRDLKSRIEREMQTFRNLGERGTILDVVYKILIAIPPTSVEAERVFSSANNFCTKTRSRLRDDTLDSLVFLKWFFNKN